MADDLSLTADYGVLRIYGADAAKFLQGQLSNDVTRLQRGHGQLAGLHNLQGRTQALLRLVCVAPDLYLAVLPRELLEAAKARLAKYVLRARVQLADATGEWRVGGRITPAGATVADDSGELRTAWCATSARQLVLRPADAAARSVADADDALEWRRLDIREAVSQVRAATSERFVAQMLNLDALGAIAFDKGCYTGQEIIARAHFRGRVKRRAQPFVLPAEAAIDPASWAPASGGRLPDGRSYEILDALPNATGAVEALLVTTESAPASAEDDAGPGATPLPWQALRAPFDIPWALD